MDINNKTQQINTFSKGMNTDVSDSLIPADQYRYAENLRFIANGNPNTGELTQIEGQDFYATLGSYIDYVVASTAVRQYMIFLGNREYYIYGELDHIDGCIIVFNTEDNHFNRVARIDGGWNASNYSLVTRWESDQNIKLYIADGEHELMSLNIMSEDDTYTSFDQLAGITTLNPIQYTIDDNSTGHIKCPIILYIYCLYNSNGVYSDLSPSTEPIRLYKDSSHGFDSNEDTGYSVSLLINAVKGCFLNIMIFRLEYILNYSLPSVYLIYDEELTNSAISFTDNGSNTMSYALAEFLAMNKYHIKPKLIESKNDYLFSANVKDTLLEANNKFINTYILWQLNTNEYYYVDDKGHRINQAYESTIIDTYGPSLMCGEKYRYGIVYYLKDGSHTSVLHVFDVDVPENTLIVQILTELPVEIINPGSLQERPNHIYKFNRVGILIHIYNIPEDCIGYRVVRCERTLNDSNTVSQGIIGNTFGRDDSQLRYASSLMSMQKMITREDGTNNITNGTKTKSDLTMFASPESSYLMDDVVNALEEYKNTLLVKEVVRYNLPILGYDYKSLQSNAYLPITTGTWYDAEDQRNNLIYENVNGIYGLNIHDDNVKVNMYDIWPIKIETDYTPINGKVSDFGHAYSPSPYSFANNQGINIGDSTTVVDTFEYINWDAWKIMRLGAINVQDYLDGLPTSSGKKCILLKSNIGQIDPKKDINNNTIVACYASVVNLKKPNISPYGGNTKQAINNNTFYSLDGFRSHNSNSSADTIAVFDGDVYNCIFTYNSSHTWLSNTYNGRHMYATVYNIPVQSRIDLFARHGDLFQDLYDQEYAYLFLDDSGKYSGLIQDNGAYLYNTAYSIGSTVDTFYTNYERGVKFDHADTRIHYSLPKTNNEMIDSWTNFKAMNFLDVDTRYGEITGLRLFKNALVYWLKGATGILSVNERTMIQDVNNSNIILGNGDVLQRYDYLSTTYGMMPNQQCDALSDTTLYWWDGYNKDIVAYAGGQQIMPMKITKQVSNYIDNGESTEHPVIAYDNKYKELIANVVSPHPIVYSEIIQQFTSVYTVEFDHRINVNNRLYFINGVGINLWNAGNQEDTKPILKYVVNDNSTVVKTFDNVQFGIGENNKYINEDPNSTEGEIENINYINFLFTTPLGLNSSIVARSNAITDREGDFRFAIPRDNGAEYGGRMRGKTMACTLSIEEGFESKNLSIQYIITKYRISWS